MAYEMIGTLKIVKDMMTFSSGFTKREFVITTEDERFPQEILFEVVKERCAFLDTLTIGERLQVTFDIRGREYNGRHFVNLTAFKINRLDVDATAAPAVAASVAAPVEMPEADPSVADDMPF